MERIKKDRKRGLALLLGLLLVFVAGPAVCAGPLEIFTSSKGITPSQSAVMITDLKTGETIISYNVDKPLIPASIMKSVTVAGLLSHTGPSYRYVTDVMTTGPAVNGVLGGDVLVIGSGDPSLNSRHLMAGGDIVSEIVKALSSKGIKRIKGKIKVDESIWAGPATVSSWGTGDLSQAYGTGQHGLNFQDNANGGKSVANPAGVFLSKMKTELASAGIVLENGEMPETKRQLLVSHQSVPVDEIMRSCMMRSDNQYAEAMLRTLAVVKNKPGSTSEGARLNTDFWTGHRAPMAGVNIVDGSGLSRQNKVTAAFMTHVLQTMWHDPYYVSFFPLAGVEGTLRKFLAGTPLESYIAMKTGSMTGIQCYAGYKLNDDYEPTHTIVVVMNQLVNRDVARKSVENMLLSLFK
ncbi:MAG: D-alanyl-D-alanine carboxypeptidase/D-alanyl-D-alanine-endopeptidase [Muribaculaceae bacterium]|nr:D-alanyl-D-alanine carboxypeptidase/D-alanyl-D-alanine-endopeptidase [Muribaculaceae bacterium]